MPELPEVEFATQRLRAVLEGRTLRAVETHHPSAARALPSATRRALCGRRVVAVTRRGKIQLARLDDGTFLVVHFRLNGDWEFAPVLESLPRYTRYSLLLDDGMRIALTDSRALATITRVAESVPATWKLGPEPDAPALTPAWLRERLARRRGPIKPALLDQSLIVGIGNIYAAEGCWRAAIHPATPADRIGLTRLARLLEGIRGALSDGHRNAGRYHQGDRRIPFRVYDREGEPCGRCGGTVRRLEQAGRSTYYCAGCQRR